MATPLDFMAPGKMTDAGMYTWAGVITVASLVASWFVAAWWHRRKERQQRAP